MIAAAEHAAQLPAFASLGEAKATLYRERDRLLAELAKFALESNGFDCTFRPDTLKALEAWYFQLLDDDAFTVMPRRKLERCIAVYFGEVLVRSLHFEWVVSEYTFSPGRYELGVRQALLSVMLTGPKRPDPRERSGRMQSLWREYLRYRQCGAGSRPRPQ